MFSLLWLYSSKSTKNHLKSKSNQSLLFEHIVFLMSVIHIVPVLYFLVGSCNIIAVVALSCRCTYLSSSHTLLHPTPMCTPSPSPTTVGLHHATGAKHIVWVRDCACVCVCVCVCVCEREGGRGLQLHFCHSLTHISSSKRTALLTISSLYFQFKFVPT